MDQADLDDLLRRARRLESAALDELVTRYSRRVFGLLYRLTRQADLAEELAQETFLRMVRTIGEYEHVGKFEAWLFRIAANLARDRVRQGVRRGETYSLDVAVEGDAPRAARLSDGEGDPHAALERREASERLAVALDRLSEADREILLLRHYSELSFREIAEMLGIPLGTALARAHRALKHLRAELGDEMQA